MSKVIKPPLWRRASHPAHCSDLPFVSRSKAKVSKPQIRKCPSSSISNSFIDASSGASVTLGVSSTVSVDAETVVDETPRSWLKLLSPVDSNMPPKEGKRKLMLRLLLREAEREIGASQGASTCGPALPLEGERERSPEWETERERSPECCEGCEALNILRSEDPMSSLPVSVGSSAHGTTVPESPALRQSLRKRSSSAISGTLPFDSISPVMRPKATSSTVVEDPPSWSIFRTAAVSGGTTAFELTAPAGLKPLHSSWCHARVSQRCDRKLPPDELLSVAQRRRAGE
mmetsp:Transcript_63227/g.139057  ORF Transcript_63227/g.139057 Transcript_63227/m.139057 type:complete len:288 (-) Transcript_63227:121-984(-)